MSRRMKFSLEEDGGACEEGAFYDPRRENTLRLQGGDRDIIIIWTFWAFFRVPSIVYDKVRTRPSAGMQIPIFSPLTLNDAPEHPSSSSCCISSESRPLIKTIPEKLVNVDV